VLKENEADFPFPQGKDKFMVSCQESVATVFFETAGGFS
jgi:hypothetical protein